MIETIAIGPERPYAVFIVAGVTHSFSAPTVLPYVEPIDLIDPDELPDATTIVVDATPAETVTTTPVVVRERPNPRRDPRGVVEFAYHVFHAVGAVWTGWIPLDFDSTPAPTTIVVETTPNLELANER